MQILNVQKGKGRARAYVQGKGLRTGPGLTYKGKGFRAKGFRAKVKGPRDSGHMEAACAAFVQRAREGQGLTYRAKVKGHMEAACAAFVQAMTYI